MAICVGHCGHSVCGVVLLCVTCACIFFISYLDMGGKESNVVKHLSSSYCGRPLMINALLDWLHSAGVNSFSILSSLLFYSLLVMDFVAFPLYDNGCVAFRDQAVARKRSRYWLKSIWSSWCWDILTPRKPTLYSQRQRKERYEQKMTMETQTWTLT